MGAVSDDFAASTVIRSIRKNQRETLRVSLSTFKDHRLLSMWCFYEDDDGIERLGKGGLNLRIAALPELQEALEDARVEAARLGWVQDKTEAQK